MNLYDWFYKQVVSPGELSAAFEAVDEALRGMVTTLGIFGLAVGGDVVPAAPTPSMSVFVKGPVLAYDDQGDRIFLPDAQLAVNLSQDENGASTAIYTPQQERYLGVFIKFTRTLADPRTDGDGNEVFFGRLEGAEVVVAAGAPAPVGTASRAALRDGHVLLADVRIVTSQTQVTTQHILTDRTQYLFRATSGSLNIWGRTFPEIVQKVVDRFAQFMTEMQMAFDQFAGTSNENLAAFRTEITNLYNTFVGATNTEVTRLAGLIKDRASQILFENTGTGMSATNVQAAIVEVKNAVPGTQNATQTPFTPTTVPGNNVQAAIENVPDYVRGQSGDWHGVQTFDEVKLKLAWLDNWLRIRGDILYVNNLNVEAPKIVRVGIPLNAFVPYNSAMWQRQQGYWRCEQQEGFVGHSGVFSYVPPYNATVRRFHAVMAWPANAIVYSVWKWKAVNYAAAYDEGAPEATQPGPTQIVNAASATQYEWPLTPMLTDQPVSANYEIQLSVPQEFYLYNLMAELSVPGPT